MILRPYAGTPSLAHTLYWPHERNEPPEHREAAAAPTHRDLAMAEALVEAMTQDTPPEQHDKYFRLGAPWPKRRQSADGSSHPPNPPRPLP